jgi:hypothetical protein
MISERLIDAGTKGLSYRSLQLFKRFYISYPQLAQVARSCYQTIDYQFSGIVQTVSAELEDSHLSGKAVVCGDRFGRGDHCAFAGVFIGNG